MSPYISNNDYQNLFKNSFLVDVRSNRLLSVESILEIDLLPPSPHSSEAAAPSAWPRDEVADAVAENSGDNYTCVATGNSIGQVRGCGLWSENDVLNIAFCYRQGVRSSTTFRVHYPPRNITVGHRRVPRSRGVPLRSSS